MNKLMTTLSRVKANAIVLLYLVGGLVLLSLLITMSRVVESVPLFNDLSSLIGAGFLLYWWVPASNRRQSKARLTSFIKELGIELPSPSWRDDLSDVDLNDAIAKAKRKWVEEGDDEHAGDEGVLVLSTDPNEPGLIELERSGSSSIISLD